MWSQRKGVEEIMSAYVESMRDLFTFTVSWDSALTSEHGCFYKHINLRLKNSHLVRPPVFSFWLVTLVLFASGLLSAISLVLYLGNLISHFCVSRSPG